jgi:hypothetical protein
MIDDVRTVRHILADLLQLAIDGEWSDRTNVACHCHPEYAASCPECDTLKYPRDDHYERKENEHAPGCKRMALINESRAFLRVENKLAEERGEEEVYFNE